MENGPPDRGMARVALAGAAGVGTGTRGSTMSNSQRSFLISGGSYLTERLRGSIGYSARRAPIVMDLGGAAKTLSSKMQKPKS